MTTIAKSTGDIVHDYLAEQIEKQFDELFPRCVLSSSAASERPAPATRPLVTTPAGAGSIPPTREF